MKMNETTIARIKRMEVCFDTLSKAVYGSRDMLCCPMIKDMLKELTEYYQSGQWLCDYEADERGELPSDLKRGVLSQDGVYNLLSDIKNSNECGF